MHYKSCIQITFWTRQIYSSYTFKNNVLSISLHFSFCIVSILIKCRTHHDCCCISFCAHSPLDSSVTFWSILFHAPLFLFSATVILYSCKLLEPLLIFFTIYKVTSYIYLFTEQRLNHGFSLLYLECTSSIPFH